MPSPAAGAHVFEAIERRYPILPHGRVPADGTNRRRCLRYEPMNGGIRVVFRPDGGKSMRGELIDVSPAGARLRCKGKPRWLQTGELRFLLRDCDRPPTVRCIVRDVSGTDSQAWLGTAFMLN